jgi:hypothetical protein
MGVKKTKKGRDTVDGFDATPPDDGDMAPGNGKKPNLPQRDPLEGGKKGIRKYLSAYRIFLVTSFSNLSREEQENWINKLALICCIGISCIILNSFYSVLLTPVRIISLPVVVGVAWLIANRLVAPAIITRLGSYMNPE